MTYAIIGSGAIGTALARQFARAQIHVRIANTRGPASLSALAAELGTVVQPAELSEALAADIVILAVPYSALGTVAKKIGRTSGQIVVDATNAINFADFSPADLGGRLSSDLVAEAFPDARLVKAFNTLPAAVLARETGTSAGRRTIFLSGNDTPATTEVGTLVSALGFAPINLGRIDEGGRLQHFGGPLMVHNLVRQD